MNYKYILKDRQVYMSSWLMQEKVALLSVSFGYLLKKILIVLHSFCLKRISRNEARWFFFAILAEKFHNSPYFTNLFYYQYMPSSGPVFPRFRKNVSQSIVLKKGLICYKTLF